MKRFILFVIKEKQFNLKKYVMLNLSSSKMDRKSPCHSLLSISLRKHASAVRSSFEKDMSVWVHRNWWSGDNPSSLRNVQTQKRNGAYGWKSSNWYMFTSFLKRKQGKNIAPNGIDFVKSYCKIKDKHILKKREDIPYFAHDNKYIRINNVLLIV